MDISIYKLKSFAKWAKSQKLKDEQLKKAMDEIDAELIEADLGNGLYKKRIARKGEGKRGGHRCLLAFKKGSKIIFLFGFSKNEKENINDEQLKFLKQLAKNYLALDDNSISKLISKGVLIEVN